jgi:L-2-hydroxycarboxylate dehydrogenase (NAD+)
MAAVDKNGQPTTNPDDVAALLPFGAHKGYGLSLLNEVVGAFIGGSLPTLRNRWQNVAEGEKGTCAFFFQVIHPEALGSGLFAKGRNQNENVKAVLADVLGHGNTGAIIPGQFEADFAKHTAAAGGLLFTKAEVEAFNEVARECAQPEWNLSALKAVTV